MRPEQSNPGLAEPLGTRRPRRRGRRSGSRPPARRRSHRGRWAVARPDWAWPVPPLRSHLTHRTMMPPALRPPQLQPQQLLVVPVALSPRRRRPRPAPVAGSRRRSGSSPRPVRSSAAARPALLVDGALLGRHLCLGLGLLALELGHLVVQRVLGRVQVVDRERDVALGDRVVLGGRAERLLVAAEDRVLRRGRASEM